MVRVNLWVRCSCTAAIGSCSRVRPPMKSSLSVKSQTPAIASTYPLAEYAEAPTSGLNDQRLVPRLISFVESYWPSGGATVRLTPTMVWLRNEANSFGVIVGAP